MKSQEINYLAERKVKLRETIKVSAKANPKGELVKNRGGNSNYAVAQAKKTKNN